MDTYNIKVITYEQTGEQDIVTFSNPIQGKKQKEVADPIDGNIQEKPPPTPKEIIDKANHSINSSLGRTKQQIYDYARANKWDWFLTFTFNAVKVDRYDYDKVSGKMSNWLKDVKKDRAPDLKYIVVPEHHKDGAIHFHALVSNTGTLKFVDSGHKDKGQIIYNLTNYKLGFTTATRVKDTLKASNYICKYITKELVAHTPNKKRYWASKNLAVGQVEKSFLDQEAMALIHQAYEADSKRHKKVEIALNDFHQTINYFTV